MNLELLWSHRMAETGLTAFVFFSQLMGRRITDGFGDTLGRVHDLVAKVPDFYPRIEGLVISRGAMSPALSLAKWQDIEVGPDFGLRLKVKPAELGPWQDQAAEGRLRLKSDLLDRQIVDTSGRKVVRVNDVHLMWTGTELRIAHIDVGLRGIVRRLGLEKAVDGSVRTLFGGNSAYLMKESLVSWKYVEMFAKGGETGKGRLNIDDGKISDLHPVELAEIMEDLDSYQREALFKSLDRATAAEALSEFNDPKMQETLLSAVGEEKAAGILEKMPPDEAADLLGEMPREKAQDLIGKMQAEDASTVKELLHYGEDTAGGLMTTEFIRVRRGLKVGEVYDILRHEADEAEIIYYLYVVDGDGRLVGVTTLKQLILADPGKSVDEIMVSNPEPVGVDDGMDKVAEVTTKYNLLAVPVVDSGRVLKGVITIDDVFGMVLETGWRKKLKKG